MHAGGTFVFAQVHVVRLLGIDVNEAGIDFTDLGIFFGLGPHIRLDKIEKCAFIRDAVNGGIDFF